MKVAATPQSPLPPEKERRVRQELQAGETALWTGQPAPGRMLRQQSMMLACGILVGLGGLLFEAVSAHNHSLWGMLASAVLTMLGLWTGLQGVRLAVRASRSAYAVTNRRVLIFSGDGPIISLTPGEIQARTLQAGVSGRGDLYFDCLDQTITIEDGSRVEHNGFLGITDVPAVDALLRQTFDET